jgi:hypothetical protein
MKTLVSPSVTEMLFGSSAPTLQGYIEEALGAAAADYDVLGLEHDLRALIEEALPEGVTLEGEEILADDGAGISVFDIREAVGWIDVHTVAVGHDMAGPGS